VRSYDFIFSNRPTHRIARHVAFWMAWWFAYSLLFHYPVHSFWGWRLSPHFPSDVDTFTTIQNRGVSGFLIKTLVFNSLLAVILPQVVFTYFLMYWLLPNRFYKKRDPFLSACVVIAVLLIYGFVAIGFKFFAPIGNYILGQKKTFPTFKIKSLMNPTIRDQVTTLPIVAGFALMINLVKRWWLKQKETEQLSNEKTKAELQLLKAQIHPHFLFNTLNNIYFFTLSLSPQAPEMIKKLSGMLHYILNECNQQLVALDKEIKMIGDYMALEKIRYGEQMNMTIEIPENYHNKMIAPLLLIPFVENSFKHGASKMLSHPYVKLRITIENNMLYFFIMNNRPQITEPSSAKACLLNRQGNIGLKNVKKRLHLLYPAAHELNIVSESENYTVYLKIQLQELTASSADNKEIKSTAAYAMA
jgi:sensor histidine kinase YesM